MIQSVERALSILNAIASAGGAARLKDVARQTALNTSTAHNLLKTLEAQGYVRRRPDDMRYHIGARILNLARVAGDDRALRQRLRPALEAVADTTGETAFLAVPSGNEVVFLDAIESERPLVYSSPLGQRMPMAGAAIGLVFLAFIPGLREHLGALYAQQFGEGDQLGEGVEEKLGQVAAQGYALDFGAYEPGIHCAAVPWKDDGETRAGVGISGPAGRLPRERLAGFAEAIAKELEQVA